MGTEFINCFTVDVEDYFHICGLPDYQDPSRWDSLPSRVEANTERVLNLLDREGVKATFFVLGWVAQRFPDLIRKIASYDHEIASHGFNHSLIYEMTPEQFREDLKKSIDMLEQIVEQKVLGFRATSFSIKKQCLWALDIVAELGLKYDASMFPATREHGGIPGTNRFLHRWSCENGTNLWEFPMSTANILGKTIPFTGGGYLRLFPIDWICDGVRRLNTQRQPAIFYIHPREFDPEQPRLPMPAYRRFKCYYNLAKTEPKLRKLLSQFQFKPIREVIESVEQATNSK